MFHITTTVFVRIKREKHVCSNLTEKMKEESMPDMKEEIF